MSLILELLAYFGVGFVGTLIYQLGFKKRAVVESLHLAAIVGMAFMLISFVILLFWNLITR